MASLVFVRLDISGCFIGISCILEHTNNYSMKKCSVVANKKKYFRGQSAFPIYLGITYTTTPLAWAVPDLPVLLQITRLLNLAIISL